MELPAEVKDIEGNDVLNPEDMSKDISRILCLVGALRREGGTWPVDEVLKDMARDALEEAEAEEFPKCKSCELVKDKEDMCVFICKEGSLAGNTQMWFNICNSCMDAANGDVEQFLPDMEGKEGHWNVIGLRHKGRKDE